MPNGSFEERVNCVWNNGDVEDAPPWFSPTAATPDVFHQCAVVNENPCPWPDEYILDPWLFGIPTNALGCESSFDGAGYAGSFFFGTNNNGYDGYKEYLGVRLAETLEAGTQYTLEFHVSLPERIGNAIWNFQVYFSPDSIFQNNDTYIDVEPQLSGSAGEFLTSYDGWYDLVWEFTATGDETFMYIGNFQPDSETDTLFVLEIEPQENFSLYSYYYIDKVVLKEGTLNTANTLSKQGFRIYPNPVSNRLFFESDNLLTLIKIFDLNGKCVKEIESFHGNKYMLTTGLSKGMYILNAYYMDGQMDSKKFIKR